MRKSLKIAAVVAVAFLALGSVAFVYAYSQNGLTTNANERMGMQHSQTFFLPDNVTAPCPMERAPRMRGNGFQWNVETLQNATLSTVDGTIVSEVKNMLILDTSSGQIRISLPADWTVGNEVVDRVSLFNSSFASAGQNVTVKVLKNDLLTNTSFSINVMLAYEATNATGTNAYAVLPFNIQPNS